MQQFPSIRIGDATCKDEAENGDNRLIMHISTPVFSRARAAQVGGILPEPPLSSIGARIDGSLTLVFSWKPLSGNPCLDVRLHANIGTGLTTWGNFEVRDVQIHAIEPKLFDSPVDFLLFQSLPVASTS